MKSPFPHLCLCDLVLHGLLSCRRRSPGRVLLSGRFHNGPGLNPSLRHCDHCSSPHFGLSLHCSVTPKHHGCFLPESPESSGLSLEQGYKIDRCEMWRKSITISHNNSCKTWLFFFNCNLFVTLDRYFPSTIQCQATTPLNVSRLH